MSKGDSSAADSRIVGVSAVVAAFMIAQQIASKAVRDGFFLSEFDVTSLPVATLAGAAVSFAAALVLGKFIASFAPSAAVPVLFGINATLFLVESMLAGSMPRLVAAALYLHTAAFGGAVVSGFWSVMNERFDPYTARKAVGRIAGGTTFGGVLGGALTWWFSDVTPCILLGGFGAGSLLCAVGIALVARGGQREGRTREPAALLSGVAVLVNNPYPRSIGLVVLIGALMTGTVDYVFKAGVAEATPGASLVGFFAVFYTVVGITTFLVQALGSRRILRWLGVVPTVALYPLVALSLLGAALVAPGLFTLVLLRGGAMVVENSLYRSGYELLYTAVPREQKRSAKMLVDLGCDRLGTAAASGLVLLLIALAAVAIDRTLLLAALVAAVAIVAILVGVRREYVASLASQLRRATARDEDRARDPAVQLASTFVGEVDFLSAAGASSSGSRSDSTPPRMSRQELLEQVRARAADKLGIAPPTKTSLPAPLGMVSERLLETPLRERLRRAEARDPDLLRSAPATIGQLGDILLSGRESVDVRLRAAELLASVPSPRSAAALIESLHASELRLRRMGALALLRVCAMAPALRPPRRTLTELAERELRRPSGPLGPRIEFEQQSPFRADARGKELSPSLELVFLLLAIGGDTEELRLALSGITSEDPLQRGTGLEYLDNLLPGDLRARVLSLAEHPELTQADRRVSAEVVQRLAAELRAGQLSVRELRRAYREARRAHYDQRS